MTTTPGGLLTCSPAGDGQGGRSSASRQPRQRGSWPSTLTTILSSSAHSWTPCARRSPWGKLPRRTWLTWRTGSGPMPGSLSFMAPSSPSRTARWGRARSKIPGASMSAGHKLGLSHLLTTKPACGRDSWHRQGHRQHTSAAIRAQCRRSVGGRLARITRHPAANHGRGRDIAVSQRTGSGVLCDTSSQLNTCAEWWSGQDRTADLRFSVEANSQLIPVEQECWAAGSCPSLSLAAHVAVTVAVDDSRVGHGRLFASCSVHAGAELGGQPRAGAPPI